ncbi:hypothetical protein N799_09900 [Lysobacter arseniciresistens ZS79]|uniref:Uncharacterized protein n=2 Tax=Novilysobacter TaxID=3382699 RepID=A0A0A0EUG4_9GAMM|nr:hypothetical protein N799_09900 [Lysobacter arseniciresistens ZS79]
MGAAKVVNAGITAATAPVRRTLSRAVGDFAAGFAGAAPAAAPKPAVTAPAGGQAPAAANTLPNAPARRAQGAATAAAPAATAAVETPAPAAPKPGSPQTFTGSNGVTRQLPSYAPSGGVQSQSFGGVPTPVQRTLSQPVVASDNPTRHQAPANQGSAVIGNPGGTTGGVYGGEAQRRLENALMTVGRRSPSVRRGLMEAYMQQQGGQQQAALAGQNNAAAAALQQQRDVAAANEAFAGRRLDAAQFNVRADLQRGKAAAQGQRVMRTLTDQAGTTNVLRADGTLTPLTGADGAPVRELSNEGRITPAIQYEALSEQIKAINENTMLKPDERQAMLAPLQARVTALTSRNANKPPTLDQFLAAAEQNNSRMTTEQLTTYFNDHYGADR